MTNKFQQIHELQIELSQLRWLYWKESVVFTFQWWFVVIALIVLLLIWLKVVDRRNLTHILLYGFIQLTIVLLLDVLGGELQLWDYPYMVLPWGPRIICVNLMIALFYMFIFQFFQTWKTFIIGATILAFVFAFIFEPIAVMLNIYKPYMWKAIYSFPIYILLQAFGRWLVLFIKKIEGSK